MHHKFRDKIKANFVELVTNIEPDILVKFLLEKKAFNVYDKKAVFALKDYNDYKHNNRLIIFRILKKNDDAFHNFVEGLELFGLRHLFTTSTSEIIEPRGAKKFKEAYNEKCDQELAKISNLNISSDIDIETPDLSETLDNIRRPLVVEVTMAKNFQNIDCDKTYDTKSVRRGQVLIINNRYFDKNKHKERKGSNYDVQALTQLFKQMYMQVQVHEDLLVNDIQRVVEDFAQFNDSKISDICVVVIMSHGEERNKDLVVLDKNDQALDTSWIEEQFNNVNCTLFSGKPKIFFYQFCRGFQMDYATTKQSNTNNEQQHRFSNTETESNWDEIATETDGCNFQTERRLEDVLVGYATQKGRRAHRDPTWGSWYIQLICEVFMERAHNSHIVEMLNEVDRRLKLFSSAEFSMQTSSYTSNGFNKNLYFNPGIYLDDNGIVQNFV